MDLDVLEPLDLNKSEIALYKAVLKAGQLTPTEVAKVTNLKRTTAYNIARALVEKGLLVEDATRRPAVFLLADAEQVLTQITKEKKQLAEREESYQKIAAEISKLTAGKEYVVPTVRFVEESKIEDFLKKNATVWDETAVAVSECTWWGFQDHTFVEQYADWIEWYWLRWNERMDLKLLSNGAKSEVDFAKKNKHLSRRNIKFWGEALNFYSTTWIVGDYVIMINTRTKPFYLVEIHDKLMAHDQREVFRNLWEMVE
jgi:sugar-specific transcriptional regulator TrmB